MTEHLQPQLLAASQPGEGMTLGRSQALLQAGTEGSSDAIYVKDAQGRYLMCNASACQLLGRSLAAVLGQDDTALFPPEEARRIMEGDRQVMAADTPQTQEEYLTCHGEARTFLSTKAPVRDAEGRVVGLLSIARDITERKKAELALLESEQRYRDLVEHANSIILRWTRDGRVTFLNEYGQKFFGYSAAELVGQHVVGTLVPESDSTRRDLRPLMDQICAHPEAFEQNTNENMRRNGQRVWIAWTNKLVRDEQGQVKEILSIGSDVTERRLVLEALRQSEEQFRLIMDNLTDLVAVLDLEGRRLYNSPSYTKLLGDPELLVGTCSFEQIHPEDRERVRETFRETIRTGLGQRMEYRLVDQEGQVRHIESQGSVIRDARAQVTKVLVVSRDITERRRAEETLRESEIRYRFLFEQNPMPMLIYERGSFQLLAVNEAFLRHYGYSHAEALALRLTDLYPEEEKSKIAAVAARLQGHAHVGEWRHRKRDGTFITIVASSHDLNYQGREARVAVMTDITERKRAEQELQAARDGLEERVRERTAELALAKERAESADRTKSAFLATMSHELRTPLNSIIGFTGLMLQGLAGPLNPEQSKQLRMVKESGQHLLALINDVLDISKIEAGQIEIAAAPFEVPQAIEKVVQTVTPLADKKRLPVLTRIAPEVGRMASDRRRVEQILLNLVSNALKFTERGHVLITARLDSGVLRLAVTDTGLGIKPEDLGKLFEPFRQLDTGLTRQHEGTGLGLAICKRLAERLGGAISVESHWGVGSTFELTLPAAPHNAP